MAISASALQQTQWDVQTALLEAIKSEIEKVAEMERTTSRATNLEVLARSYRYVLGGPQPGGLIEKS